MIRSGGTAWMLRHWGSSMEFKEGTWQCIMSQQWLRFEVEMVDQMQVLVVLEPQHHHHGSIVATLVLFKPF
ncbi:MAG: hypothetical protein AAFS10_04395 [Myxococcota bacterium]